MGLLLVAGLLADAMDRRKLMMCTDIGLFGVSMTLALLTLAGKASPGLLYTATALLAIFNSLETPARQSIIPNLVPREELAQTLALQGTQRYVPIIAGPSLAGVVFSALRPGCMLYDRCIVLAGHVVVANAPANEATIGKGLGSCLVQVAP